jgi:hypothetical protein
MEQLHLHQHHRMSQNNNNNNNHASGSGSGSGGGSGGVVALDVHHLHVTGNTGSHRHSSGHVGKDKDKDGNATSDRKERHRRLVHEHARVTKSQIASILGAITAVVIFTIFAYWMVIHSLTVPPNPSPICHLACMYGDFCYFLPSFDVRRVRIL